MLGPNDLWSKKNLDKNLYDQKMFQVSEEDKAHHSSGAINQHAQSLRWFTRG